MLLNFKSFLKKKPEAKVRVSRHTHVMVGRTELHPTDPTKSIRRLMLIKLNHKKDGPGTFQYLNDDETVRDEKNFGEHKTRKAQDRLLKRNGVKPINTLFMTNTNDAFRDTAHPYRSYKRAK